MTVISGVLTAPDGSVLPNVSIILKAISTSSQVVVQTESTTVTGTNGAYSISAKVGEYQVSISAYGQPTVSVGNIQIFPDSPNGTLNDFLTTPGEDALTPAIVATVESMRIAAQSAASDAIAARDLAKSYADSAQNAASGVGLKPDKATGLAQTTNGQTFSVAGLPGSGVAVYVYRNDSGTATLVYTLSSKDAVDAVAARVANSVVKNRKIMRHWSTPLKRTAGWISDTGQWFIIKLMVGPDSDQRDIYTEIKPFTRLSQNTRYKVLWFVGDASKRLAFWIKSDGSANAQKLIVAGHDIGSEITSLDTRVAAIESQGSSVYPLVGNGAGSTAQTILSGGLKQIQTAVAGYIRTITSSGNNFFPAFLDANNVSFITDRNGANEYYYAPAAGGDQWPVKSSGTIYCWGDSLTQGASGSSFGSILADISGRSVSVQGLGGQDSTGIAARQGGRHAVVVSSTGQIPASGAVALTSVTPALLTAPTTLGSSISLTGYIEGVHGTLNKNASDAYTFTRSEAGSAVVLSASSYFVADNAIAGQTGTAIFWVGRNNAGAAATIVSDLRSMVDYIKPYIKNIIIIGITNTAAEISGSSGYNQVATTNSAILSAFPNYYFDWRSLWVGGYDPAQAQDVIDHANDVPPTSLRRDDTHENLAGRTLLANKLLIEINARGY
ncbi:prophage tail fiber N-terminal domain-containing protein [Acerihabitans sp.]|uniref:prophage tail fiber N-terminal domain-containing protein n=1 Tax=Acerihabitans sp. TaxID=2811394 RepID=UPI002ED84C62